MYNKVLIDLAGTSTEIYPILELFMTNRVVTAFLLIEQIKSIKEKEQNVIF